VVETNSRFLAGVRYPGVMRHSDGSVGISTRTFFVVARTLVFVLLASTMVVSGTTPIQASEDIYEMYFPVQGGLDWTDTFGAPRGGGRTHTGNDLMSPKMTPVLAVASGTVGWIDDEQGGDCCAMALEHDDGWASWYIHLNNDTFGTDDGLGFGFAPGIVQGARVQAGQLIGWVGDSGNAENSGSHVHFELHTPDGVAINPYPSLQAATVLDAPLPIQYNGAFWDDEGSVHEANIDALAELGVTTGCDEGQFCPADSVTRAQMATFLVRALSWETGGAEDAFTDDNGSPHEANINEMFARGITTGCQGGGFCPDEFVTRAQMATFLVRAFSLTAGEVEPAGQDPDMQGSLVFADIGGSPHEANINVLASSGVTSGCEDGLYCPGDDVNRAQMATFLIRAIDTLNADAG